MKLSIPGRISLLTVLLTATALAQPQGVVKLHLGEGGHYVYLDQVNRGLFPADTILTLPVGDHIVSFFNAAYRVPQLGIDLRDYERQAFLAGLTAFTVSSQDTVDVRLSWSEFRAALQEGALSGNRRASILALVLSSFGGLLWILFNS